MASDRPSLSRRALESQERKGVSVGNAWSVCKAPILHFDKVNDIVDAPVTILAKNDGFGRLSRHYFFLVVMSSFFHLH